jgi:hypothetical protein
VAIRFALGAPRPSRLERAERLGILAAVALIGSDMIASSVYGPEEMVRRLGEVGPGGVAAAVPVGIASRSRCRHTRSRSKPCTLPTIANVVWSYSASGRPRAWKCRDHPGVVTVLSVRLRVLD